MLSVIIEGFFALFAAIGAATIVWMIIGIFIKPDSCEGVRTYTVINADSEDADVCKAVKALLWWQDMVPEEREIVVCGSLSGQTRERLEFIEKQHYRLTMLSADELSDYLKGRMAEHTTR